MIFGGIGGSGAVASGCARIFLNSEMSVTRVPSDGRQRVDPLR
jgi:hypothetical protein